MTASLGQRERVATVRLHPGDVVLTQRHTVGTDFGIPLVAPTTGRARAVPRTVRNRVRTGAGQVVWFTDGTKSAPCNGRTAWTLSTTDTEEG